MAKPRRDPKTGLFIPKRLRPPRSEYESRKIQWERDPPLTMKELQELDRL